MISPAAAELIRRGREQIRSGIQCALSGEIDMARVWFAAANASLAALHALLDAPAPPLRKMALVVVGPREEEAEPEWFARKANDNGGDGAA